MSGRYSDRRSEYAASVEIRIGRRRRALFYANDARHCLRVHPNFMRGAAIFGMPLTDGPTLLDPVSGADIPPRVGSGAKPRITVAIPVYEPGPFLLEALAGVLKQDLGPDKMQIIVIDDASPSRDVVALAAQSAPPGRIEFYRSSRNQGLASNWNQCIRAAQGDIVHILHQDDWIADGFYERLLPAFEDPSLGMAFCRHGIASASKRIERHSHRERWRAGVLRGWLERIAERQRVQCASALVRRAAYEKLGGYRRDLCYALDWEMWVRIAAHYEVWYEPRELAYYRRHEGSETTRLADDNTAAFDVVKAIEINSSHVPDVDRARVLTSACLSFAQRTLKQLRKQAATGRDIAKLLEPVRAVLSLQGLQADTRRRIEKGIEELEAG